MTEPSGPAELRGNDLDGRDLKVWNHARRQDRDAELAEDRVVERHLEALDDEARALDEAEDWVVDAHRRRRR